MILLSNINKDFGTKTILDDANHAIYEGEKIGIIGKKRSRQDDAHKTVAQKTYATVGRNFHAAEPAPRLNGTGRLRP